MHEVQEVRQKEKISMHAIDTEDQQAEIMTKPLEKDKLEKLRKLTMYW